VRVKDRLAYGGLMGKKIDGPVYNFKGVRNVKNPRFVSASDWHFHKDRFVAAAQFVENPDIFLFLGDGADYYVNDRQTIACLFAPLALVTGGRIPILFTRGNHEVRADYDNADLWRKIGLKDGYNHRVERGDFLFTILDSAECDKEDNADWEHMDVYDMERYTEHTLTYLDSLAPRPDKYNILLVHDRTFMKEKNDRRVRYNAQVHRLGIQLNISGDSHHFVYFEHPEEGVVRGFEDGGVFVRTNYPYPKHLLNIFTRAVTGFTLAQIDFSDNEITFKEIDDLGAEIKSYTIPR
jgi:hypothetical protein